MDAEAGVEAGWQQLAARPVPSIGVTGSCTEALLTH